MTLCRGFMCPFTATCPRFFDKKRKLSRKDCQSLTLIDGAYDHAKGSCPYYKEEGGPDGLR